MKSFYICAPCIKKPFLDSQKDAFTFGDQNSFVSLNVSSMKELKFKFRRFKLSKQPKEGQVIASFQVSAQKPAIKVGNIRKL